MVRIPKEFVHVSDTIMKIQRYSLINGLTYQAALHTKYHIITWIGVDTAKPQEVRRSLDLTYRLFHRLYGQL